MPLAVLGRGLGELCLGPREVGDGLLVHADRAHEPLAGLADLHLLEPQLLLAVDLRLDAGLAAVDVARELLLTHLAAVLAPRLSRYLDRFAAALAAVQAGDESMVASPLKDSYHTVWFEMHEELILLSGRNRADEAAAGRGA